MWAPPVYQTATGVDGPGKFKQHRFFERCGLLKPGIQVNRVQGRGPKGPRERIRGIKLLGADCDPIRVYNPVMGIDGTFRLQTTQILRRPWASEAGL